MERSVQLKCFVVDTSLPQHDDSVEDQVLAAWPKPSSQQASQEYGLVRLACAGVAVCHSFTEERCSHIAFERRAVVIAEPEPHILWILQAPSQYGQVPLCPQRAVDVLRRMHGLFCLLHQTVADATAACGLLSCKTMLSAFLRDYMPAFEGKATSLWANMTDLYMPLTPHRGLPLSTISGETFRGLQSLVASLKATQVLPGRDTLGVMLTFKQAVLHTTLSAGDSEALYLLASRTAIPATRAENKTTRTLHKLYSSVADWGSVSQRALDAAAWHVAAGGDLEGIITYGGEPSARCGHCPLLFAQRERACRLIVWQHAGFQILLLADGDGEVHAADLAGARRHFAALLHDLDATYTLGGAGAVKSAAGFVTHVAELVRAQDKRHVPGHRYSITDVAASAPLCAATPASKLASATSQSAQAVLSQLWSDAQQHMALDALRAAPISDGVATAATAPAAVGGASNTSPAAPAASPMPSGAEAGPNDAGAATQHESDAAQRQESARSDAASAQEDAQAPEAKSQEQLPDGSQTAGASPQQQDAAETSKPSLQDTRQASTGAGVQPTPTVGAGPAAAWGCGRMEVAAHTPGKKWVAARWALGSELLHIDDTTTRDNNALAAAGRNVQGLVDKYFPGALGL